MFLAVLACVSVCLCVSVCDHDNYKDCGRICTKFYGKVPRGQGRPSSCFVTIGRGDAEVMVKELRKPAIVYILYF